MRGIIEGFYGQPWSQEARLAVIEFAGRHGFDTYVYAPKDEPKQRRDWRQPYDAAELARFAELAEAGRAADVALVYCISPGLDIRYSLATDFRALSAKIAQARAAGFSAAMLAFDDIDAEVAVSEAARFGAEPGAAQAYLANWLYREQRTLAEPFHLYFVPTQYHGVTPSTYLAALRELLNREIDVIWTGPEVVSPAITAAAAHQFAALVGRPPVLWDNYPVNDYKPERLFLGPLLGRAPDLPRVLRGILVNPMVQARASLVALGTYAAYLSAPERYDPEAALQAAIAEVGGSAASALADLVEFQRQSPLEPRRAVAAGLVKSLAGGPDEQAEADLLRLQGVPEAIGQAATAGLADEVAPWTGKLARAAAVARSARAGGDREGLRAEIGSLRADPTDIAAPLLDYAERVLAAEPSAVARG